MKAHGPHVTQRLTPEFSEVTLEVLLTDSNAVVTFSRNMKNPGKYKLDPDTPYNRRIFDEVGLHPEIVLSRREIINLIITQATDRSVAVQTLLKLDGIDKTRKALGTASTKLKDEAETASSTLNTRTGDLVRHLGIEKLDSDSVVSFANEKRASLGLGPLDSVADSASFTDGLDDAALSDTFNKESALRDIDAAQEFFSTCVSTNKKTCESLVIDLCEIEENPSLLDLIDTAELVTMGIELVDSPECPLCDLAWDDIDALKEHLDEKLRNSASAVALAERLVANGKILTGSARKIQSHIVSIEGLPSELAPPSLAQCLKDWNAELETFIFDAASLSGLRKAQTQFSTGWPAIPPNLSTLIFALRSVVDAKSDQSAPAAAASALGIAGERFAEVKKAESAAAAATKAADIAKVLHETYLIVSANVLESIYKVVEQDFSKFYKMINGEDEERFKANFKQDGGKLELEVEFYGQGTASSNGRCNGSAMMAGSPRTANRWNSPSLTMSVNFAAAQLERDDVIDDVQTALALSHLGPERLVVEITESTLMIDVQQTLARLRQLKSIGVRIAIDDFGTGYSSFAYLAQFPIDVLKIDKSFISAIADSSSTAAIVHTLIQLGKMLGLEIVAEGVENDEQRRFLVSEKVGTVQGFLFARPMAAHDVERLLNGTAGSSPHAVASS